MILRGGSISRGSWPLVGLVALNLLGAGPAIPSAPTGAISGPPGGFSNRSDDELLLFEVRLQGSTLSDTFPGYPVKDGVLVPLGELCRMLGLAITTDPLTGKAKGFFISENRTFTLDAGSNTVSIEGRSAPFDVARDQIVIQGLRWVVAEGCQLGVAGPARSKACS